METAEEMGMIEKTIEGVLLDNRMMNEKRLGACLNYGKAQIIRALQNLTKKGIILKDSRCYYHHSSKYIPRPHHNLVIKQAPLDINLEATFERIADTITNLLADVKNSVEEVRRLRLQNQDLTEKIVKINAMLCGKGG